MLLLLPFGVCYLQTYVQDLIEQEFDSLYNLIVLQRGHVYVCGDVTMAEHVYQTIRWVTSSSSSLQCLSLIAFVLWAAEGAWQMAYAAKGALLNREFSFKCSVVVLSSFCFSLLFDVFYYFSFLITCIIVRGIYSHK